LISALVTDTDDYGPASSVAVVGQKLEADLDGAVAKVIRLLNRLGLEGR